MALMHVDGEPCTSLSLPHAAQSVRAARKQMVVELHEYGVSQEFVLLAELVLGELAANAVEHGQPIDGAAFEVSWCVVGNRLRLSVIDGGCVPELRPEVFDVTALRGRGLQIVDTVCDHWVADFEGGTRITAELSM